MFLAYLLDFSGRSPYFFSQLLFAPDELGNAIHGNPITVPKGFSGFSDELQGRESGILSVRNRMIKALREELLGPRGGPHERLRAPQESPKSEYMTGILEPQVYDRDPSPETLEAPDTKPLGVEEEDFGEEDEGIEEEQLFPAPLGSALDPRAFAKSLGISFTVRGEDPSIDICVTYGTYVREGNFYLRKPHSIILRRIKVDKDSELHHDEWTTLSCFSRKGTEGQHVSLYLVNNRAIEAHIATLHVEDLVFQPQIRVLLNEGTEKIPVQGKRAFDKDEAQFELLFHEKLAYARGHMCGATWREEDPELDAGQMDRVDDPFTWIDGKVLDDDTRMQFTAPDYRTEYLPIYLIEQVRMHPKDADQYRLSAGNLAETWSYNSVCEKIEPLLNDYEQWIEQQVAAVDLLPDELQTHARAGVDSCKRAAARMREGLACLSDDDVRLSFCFMNKAIDIQFRWKDQQKHTGKESSGLTWYPFQLAFILLCIPTIVDRLHPDRKLCDVLWFPTGGGKTEAYLGLALFSLAYRRRRGGEGNQPGLGTAVLSRYTLRLLTVQQFRRASSVITAAELLRVKNWKPSEAPETPGKPLWGTFRFSVGLWVGGGVTPNRIAKDSVEPSAITVLRGLKKGSEPAQIQFCPACGSILSMTDSTIDKAGTTLHFLVRAPSRLPQNPVFPARNIKVKKCVHKHFHGDIHSVRLHITSDKANVPAANLVEWWEGVARHVLNDCELCSVSAKRPGYFIRQDALAPKGYDFEIHCPNADCELNSTYWYELEPCDYGLEPKRPLEPFRVSEDAAMPYEIEGVTEMGLQLGIPIPAYTCDDQVYHRLPSLVIATVDKFARLPYEPRAAAIFGNINRFDVIWGFFREGVPPKRSVSPISTTVNVTGVDPPDLIIQDELHLIQGPLGTMVGLYETAVGALTTKYIELGPIIPKYIASSATVRHSESQVQAVFNRTVSLFPPQAMNISDSFFSQEIRAHPVHSTRPGRIYMGVCAPGKGGHTPAVRLWAAVLQRAWIEKSEGLARPEEVDQFWTAVGYFNAIRELAGVRSLYRQDIVSQIKNLSRGTTWGPREIPPTRLIELSSRVESAQIPRELTRLEKYPDNRVDAVLTTSMFGTGVDVSRLGLMIVHGQPKTTASYIQATGRVGRRQGGLVVTFLRSTRPRDLDHYEFFVGYHQQLLKYVEPITVYPYSARALERAAGPVMVGILRNAASVGPAGVSPHWAEDGQRYAGALRMARHRNDAEIEQVKMVLLDRSQNQPEVIQPLKPEVERLVASEVEKWWSYAANDQDGLLYVEYDVPWRELRHSVVLGDPEHDAADLPTVYKNAPQSLRDVESTTRFG